MAAAGLYAKMDLSGSKHEVIHYTIREIVDSKGQTGVSGSNQYFLVDKLDAPTFEKARGDLRMLIEQLPHYAFVRTIGLR